MMRLRYTNYLSFLPAIMLTGCLMFTSCSQDENQMDSSAAQKIVFDIRGENAVKESRAVAESANLTYSVGMSAYTGDWDEYTSLPNFFYNEEVMNTGMGHWETSGAFFKPEDGTKRRFFAYYPYCDAESDLLHNISLSSESTPGVPEFDYTVPSNVEDQQDLMVGFTGEEQFGASMDVIQMKLYHLLTAIRFETGTVMHNGKITKITIKGVRYKGTYVYPDVQPGITPTIQWNSVNQGAIADFSLELSKNISASDPVGTAITASDQSFLMMPQTLNANAYLEVTFDDGQEHVLKASLGGKVWERAKIVTYRISMSSLMRLTITSTIEDWDSTSSITGEVSDAANLRNEADINDWSAGTSQSN